MNGGRPYFFDRVAIYLPGGIPYLPNGMIRNFRMGATYNTVINQGFSPDGLGSGKTIGNKTLAPISWTEYLPTLGDFLNWRTFCLANPGTIITVVPITIALGVPAAPQFTISSIDPTSVDIDASGEGQAMMRSITFNAIDSSNT